MDCRLADGRNERYTFAGDGLLSRKDTELLDGQGTLSIRFDDYRRVDSILVPFRTTVALPGGTHVTYLAERVRHNEPIDDAVFAHPVL